jgi:hypothetical protein
MLRENPSERLSLFQIMNHPWVLQASQVSMEDLEKLAPDKGSDEDDALEQF